MIEGRTVLAVVPARGGSKAIPRKNLKTVGGVSLVGRAAQVAAALPFIDAALISTVDMWRHAWLTAEAHYGKRFDLSVLLEPTSPLRRPEDVERTLRALIDAGAPAAATVSPTPAHYTPHKTLKINDKGEIEFYLEGGANHSLRQGIPAYYHRNGLCYAVTRDHLVNEGCIIDRGAVAVVVDRHVVNIDDMFELELAEWLLEREMD